MSSPTFYYYGISYIPKKLNPTGKWRLRTINGTHTVLEIEHRGFFLNTWVSEDDIFFEEVYEDAC